MYFIAGLVIILGLSAGLIWLMCTMDDMDPRTRVRKLKHKIRLMKQKQEALQNLPELMAEYQKLKNEVPQNS